MSNYQPNYQPSPFSLTSIENLRQSIGRGGGDVEMAVREIERVAQNIAAALENEETPEVVKRHIKFYVHSLVYFDFTDYKETLIPLYIKACRNISQIPFVPSRDYIEALTGNSKSDALETAKKAGRDDKVFKSISKDKAQKLTHEIFDGFSDVFANLDLAYMFAALIYAVGNEINPSHRKGLVDKIIHQALFETLYYGEESNAFFEKAFGYIEKLPKGK